MINRIENEIKHGKYIVEKGEEIWNWSSPAGQLRWKRRVKIFHDILGNNQKKVLEIGCGTGLFTKEIAKTNNNITAIDISNELLEIAQRNIENKDVVFELKNAYETRYKDSSFDYIVGSSVLHHLDIELAIKEFYRILKPNGKILFTEPNMLNPQIFLERNVGYFRKIMHNSPDETAFIRWKLRKILTDNSFNNIDIKPFDFLHPATPNVLIRVVIVFSKILEKLPLIREIAGSLIIRAEKLM